MMRAPRRGWLVAALGAAVVALVGSVTAVVAATGVASGTSSTSGRETTLGSMMSGTQSGRGTSVMGGTQFGAGMSMMGGGAVAGLGMGSVWLAGDGAALTSIASARQRAAMAAAPDGLHPGEVIWFDNGFYVELKDSSGASATEVLVDPVNGAVTTEPGPAMMWNTRYGMRFAGGAASTPAITAEHARQIADRWLRDNLPG